MWDLFPSASAAMTLPSADRDLLIFFASSSTEPSAPVLLTCGQKCKEFKKQNLFFVGNLTPLCIKITFTDRRKVETVAYLFATSKID